MPSLVRGSVGNAARPERGAAEGSSGSLAGAQVAQQEQRRFVVQLDVVVVRVGEDFGQPDSPVCTS